MLLKYLRKKTRAILIVTLILIIPAFILLYGWSRSSTRDKIPYVIAKVGSTPITWNEYQEELTRYKNLLGKSYSPEVEKKVLDSLIEKYLLIIEAKRKNIKVDDDEIITGIKEIFKDEGGKFDKEKFLLISNQYPEQINALEENIRTQIAIGKLKDIITNLAEVSEDEAYKYFLTSDAKAKIKYILIKSDDLRENIEVSEKELKDYYEQHKESFKDGPWRKVEYVLISEDKIGQGEINVAPEELEQYYSEHLQEWTGENGDTEPLPLSEVKDEIEAKLKEGKKEANLKNKAFETSLKLLEENDWSWFAKNEDISYGITGYFAKEEPISEFNAETIKTAFSLPFNAVSEPLKIGKGYVIIRPLDEEPQYDEIADKIKNIIRDEKSKDSAEKKAEEIVSELQKGVGIEDIAKKYLIEVKESGYFSRHGFIEDIGYTPEVTQAAFSLEKGKWNKVITAPGEIFIIQTIDIKEPSKEEFQASKERTTTLLLYQKKQKVFMEWLKELKEKNKDKISILWDELK